eukprot:106867-Prorocentrum_minimum.AAC.2
MFYCGITWKIVSTCEPKQCAHRYPAVPPPPPTRRAQMSAPIVACLADTEPRRSDPAAISDAKWAALAWTGSASTRLFTAHVNPPIEPPTLRKPSDRNVDSPEALRSKRRLYRSPPIEAPSCVSPPINCTRLDRTGPDWTGLDWTMPLWLPSAPRCVRGSSSLPSDQTAVRPKTTARKIANSRRRRRRASLPRSSCRSSWRCGAGEPSDQHALSQEPSDRNAAARMSPPIEPPTLKGALRSNRRLYRSPPIEPRVARKPSDQHPACESPPIETLPRGVLAREPSDEHHPACESPPIETRSAAHAAVVGRHRLRTRLGAAEERAVGQLFLCRTYA